MRNESREMLLTLIRAKFTAGEIMLSSLREEQSNRAKELLSGALIGRKKNDKVSEKCSNLAVCHF